MKAHYEALRKADVPTFGRSHNPKVVQKWLKEMKDNFDLMEMNPKVVVPFFIGEAAQW